MVPKGTFPYYPALKHLLLSYHLNIISAGRYGRTLPKTGLQSGYLMLYEVRYGKSSWAVKNYSSFPIYMGLLYMNVFYTGGPLFDILQYRKECKSLGGKSRYLKIKRTLECCYANITHEKTARLRSKGKSN